MSPADAADFPYFIDEVGIAYGHFGDLRLKTVYQPLFRVDGESLAPFAVEALAIAFAGGVAVPAHRLFAQAFAPERMRLDRLCRILHVLNYRNIGVDGLFLFFNADPSLTTGDIAHFGQLLGDNAIPPEDVVCEITEAVAPDLDALADLADGMRRLGARIAVDDFGAGESTLERVRLVQPDIVKIDAEWFQKTAAHADGAGLLVGLFDGLHEMEADVLVEGIETQEHLDTALRAGADYLQGFLLGRPALAGTIFDPSPRPVAGLIDREAEDWHALLD